MIPFLNRSPGSPATTKGRLGTGTAGRPKRNGKFSLRAVNDNNAGFVQLNTEPEVLQAAKRSYIKKQQLPPSLTPRHAQPAPLRANKNKNISKGWRKPKDGR